MSNMCRKGEYAIAVWDKVQDKSKIPTAYQGDVFSLRMNYSVAMPGFVHTCGHDVLDVRVSSIQ